MSEKQQLNYNGANSASDDDEGALEDPDMITKYQEEELDRLRQQGQPEQTVHTESNQTKANLPQDSPSSPLEAMALRVSQQERKQGRTSSVDLDNLNASSLHKPTNHQEPSNFASEEHNRSSDNQTTIDVDEFELKAGRLSRNVSEISSASSNWAGDEPLTPLQMVAQQAARTKGEGPGLSQKSRRVSNGVPSKRGAHHGLSQKRNPGRRSSTSSNNSQEFKHPPGRSTEETSASSHRAALTREEPGMLAGSERRRSSTLSNSTPPMIGRTSSAEDERRLSSLSAEIGDQQQPTEPKPSSVRRTTSADSNASSRSSLLVGPGAQEYAHMREELQSTDKGKVGHKRFSTLASSANESRSSIASNNSIASRTSPSIVSRPSPRSSLLVGPGAQQYAQMREESQSTDKGKAGHKRFSALLSSPNNERRGIAASATQPAIATMSCSNASSNTTNPAGMDDSSAAYHSSRRTRDEFEAKRQALASQAIVSAQMQAPQPTMVVDTNQATTWSSTQNGPALTVGKSVVETAPATSTLLESTSTAARAPDPNSISSINSYRVVPPAYHRVEEPLVEATMVREDSMSQVDSEKGESFRTEEESEIVVSERPSTRPSQQPPEQLMDVDLIVEAHPAKATEAAEDILIRNQYGQGLVCSLIVLVVLVVGGVTFAIFGIVGKEDKAAVELKIGDFNLSIPEPTIAPTDPPSVQTTTLSPTDVAPVLGSLTPTTQYQGYVVSLLPNYTLPSLEDPVSPQSLALEWLVSGHQYHQLANLTDDRILQRFALASLYYSTNGKGWRWARYWLSNHNADVGECDWFSYYEIIDSNDPTPICDDAGRIERLALNENIMIGTLPKEVALLTQLKEISLIADGFYITEYNKKDKVLSGSIPVEWMMSLTNLRTLDLTRNAISGPIPSEIGLMSNLRTLKLLENDIQSTLPTEIFQLTSLKEVWLYDNNLSGPVPTEFGLLASMGQLNTFAASKNQFSGALPSQLGLVTQLTQLKMETNQLTGSIPVELASLTNLRFFHFEHNKLTGTIHSELGQLNAIVTMWIGNNRLTGTIPTQLGNIGRVNSVGLSNNQLTGTIPTELGLLEGVNRVALDNNELTGTAPEELCRHKHKNPIFFRVFVDCDKVRCSCWCCWCNCLR